MTGNDHQDELKLGLPAGVVADDASAVPRDGLSWTWELDVEALLAAVTCGRQNRLPFAIATERTCPAQS